MVTRISRTSARPAASPTLPLPPSADERRPNPASPAVESAVLSAAQQAAGQVSRAASGLLGLHGERMSKVDTAWLRMDTPSNLMMIVGVWTLVPGIELAELRERVRSRLLQYTRFRQKVVEDAAGATWVLDDRFDLSHHVSAVSLPAAADPAANDASDEARLQAHVGRLAMEPLDRARPLWQFQLVDDYRLADGRVGSALVARIHHCIADGIALISVMLSLVDGGANPPSQRRQAQETTGGADEWIADSLIKPLTRWTLRVLDAAGDGAARSLHVLRDPAKGIHRSLDVARLAVQVASDAAALALMPDDSPTRLKGKPGFQKRVAWCQPLPLDNVKAIGKALNCSVNDVLLSCVAGALGAYLAHHGDAVQGREIRAMIPVNLRPLEDAWKLGNRFGLVPLVLPVGIANPVERVYCVRQRMNQLKGSTQPLLAFGLLAVAGLLVKPAQEALLNLFGRKTTAVMTNVPGPREKLQFCGATLEQVMFWVPQSGDIGLGVSILSYGGFVQFGVITDSTLCPDPQAIIREFEPEFNRLSLVTLMLPWGDALDD
jgi:diacylglycerol O-acyltransferase / wax synthase